MRFGLHCPHVRHTWHVVVVLHCAFESTSVVDLCMAVHIVQVPQSTRTKHNGLLLMEQFLEQPRSLHRLSCRQDPR